MIVDLLDRDEVAWRQFGGFEVDYEIFSIRPSISWDLPYLNNSYPELFAASTCPHPSHSIMVHDN